MKNLDLASASTLVLIAGLLVAAPAVGAEGDNNEDLHRLEQFERQLIDYRVRMKDMYVVLKRIAHVQSGVSRSVDAEVVTDVVLASHADKYMFLAKPQKDKVFAAEFFRSKDEYIAYHPKQAGLLVRRDIPPPPTLLFHPRSLGVLPAELNVMGQAKLSNLYLRADRTNVKINHIRGADMTNVVSCSYTLGGEVTVKIDFEPDRHYSPTRIQAGSIPEISKRSESIDFRVELAEYGSSKFCYPRTIEYVCRRHGKMYNHETVQVLSVELDPGRFKMPVSPRSFGIPLGAPAKVDVTGREYWDGSSFVKSPPPELTLSGHSSRGGVVYWIALGVLSVTLVILYSQLQRRRQANGAG